MAVSPSLKFETLANKFSQATAPTVNSPLTAVNRSPTAVITFFIRQPLTPSNHPHLASSVDRISLFIGCSTSISPSVHDLLLRGFPRVPHKLYEAKAAGRDNNQQPLQNQATAP